MKPSNPSLPYPLIRGGLELSISKVPDEFTIRSRAGVNEGVICRSAGCEIKAQLPEQALSVLSVDATHRDEAMGRIRASGEADFASHTYTLDDDPLGRIYLTDEISLQFHPGISSPDMERLAHQHGLSLTGAIQGLENGYIYKLTEQARSNPLKLAHELSQAGEVKYCEANVAIRSAYYYEPPDTLFKHQWYLHNQGGASLGEGSHIDVARAWDITRGSRSVIVAVIDDYIDINHRDLAGPGKIAFPFNLSDPNYSRPAARSYENHGTACAGLAVAEENGWGIVGVAPACALMPMRLPEAIDDNAVESLFSWAVSQGASVISNSWGVGSANFPLSVRQHLAILRASTEGRGGKGCVICFAAGNANRPLNDTVTERGWPGNRLSGPVRWYNGFAAHPAVIAVAACTSLNKKAAYSNWGTEISVCAPSNNGHPNLGEEPSYPKVSQPFPGKAVYTTDRSGRAGYDSTDYTSNFGGTSGACPLVAGVAALVLTVNPELTATEVRKILETTADKIEDHSRDSQLGLSLGRYDEKGHSPWFGFGKVNAFRAVAAAAGQVAPAVKRFSGRSAPALAISDNVYAGVADSILVEEYGLVTDVAVSLRITHSFIGDLKVSLIAPSGKTALLHDKAGGAKNNIHKTYTLAEVANLRGLLGELAQGTWQLSVQDIAPRDRGVLEEWSLSLAFTPTNLITLGVRPGIDIPDDQPFGVESTIEVNSPGRVKKITLGLEISHPFIADLQVVLVAPSGEVAVLHDRKGGASDDLNKGYSSYDTPSLRRLLSIPARGKWRLCVKDRAFRDAGRLNAWRLQLDVDAYSQASFSREK